MLPDDMGSAISDKLMDLSGYFLIVLSALYLEKYLLTDYGYATFAVLIPLACVLFSVSVFWKEVVKKYWEKISAFRFGNCIDYFGEYEDIRPYRDNL